MAVYFVRSAKMNAVKIGYTSSDPSRRLKEIQCGNPERLELLAYRPGERVDEQELHKKFAGSRMSGEWFSMSADMAVEVAMCVGEFALLAKLDPDILKVVRRCGEVKPDGHTFCANSVWYGYGGQRGIKDDVCDVVGWNRKRGPAVLQESEAYSLVYEIAYRILPDCRGRCECKSIFDTLSEMADNVIVIK